MRENEMDGIDKPAGLESDYYIMEVTGEGCYCLCYDDETGKRVVVDWDLEIREN